MAGRARRTNTEDQDFGGDSFLDIVANVVGILIILILVVGMQIARSPDIQAEAERIVAQKRAEIPEPSQPAPPAVPAELAAAPEVVAETPPKPRPRTQRVPVDLELPRRRLTALAQGFLDTVAQLRRMQLETLAREQERQRLGVELAIRTERLESRTQKLDSDLRQRVMMAREVDQLHAELGKLDEQLLFMNNPQKVVEIRHDPTAISRTVYSDELHFRLAEGRVTYLPIDRLVDRVRGDIDRQVWKLRENGRIESSVGPIDGFSMNYILRSRRVMVDRPGSRAQMGTVAEVVRWELIPGGPAMGENLEDALRPGSEFRRVLERANPRRATVTLWIYPDGFDQFRTIKEEVARLGFATAARPLPEGTPIAGSPHGSRSSAQ